MTKLGKKNYHWTQKEKKLMCAGISWIIGILRNSSEMF